MYILMISICIFIKVMLINSNVSKIFGACNNYFDKNYLPTGYPMTSDIVELCQINSRDEDKIVYATLYDTKNKIPVYSSYILNLDDTKCPEKKSWYTEKELDVTKQAIEANYKTSFYKHGYLSSNCYIEPENGTASFALTNTLPVPQAPNINLRGWKSIEKQSKQLMEKDCVTGKAFLITGAIPGGVSIIDNVNVPSFLYTAACCRQESGGGSFSFGYIGENKDNSVVDILDIVELGKKVKNNYLLPLKTTIKFFQDDCNHGDVTAVNKLKSMLLHPLKEKERNIKT